MRSRRSFIPIADLCGVSLRRVAAGGQVAVGCYSGVKSMGSAGAERE